MFTTVRFENLEEGASFVLPSCSGPADKIPVYTHDEERKMLTVQSFTKESETTATAYGSDGMPVKSISEIDGKTRVVTHTAEVG